MKKNSQISQNYEQLLSKFNDRDPVAFSQVYALFYNELYYFASRFFKDTEVASDDLIQDIFLNIWEVKSRRFNSLSGLKVYIYVCIKNRLRNYIVHKKYINTYFNSLVDDDYFIVKVAESEKLSIISQATNMLPSECAKVFKLHIDGWDVKDIAFALKKSESTVYKQKQEAISIIRKKLLTK